MNFLMTILAGLALAGDKTPTEPLGGDFGTPRVIVPAPAEERFRHLSWPKIVKTRDGTLVVVYSAGRYHGSGGENCPAVSISKDGGRTFTAPKILREFDRTTRYDDAANTALGIADDGAVVLLAMAYKGNERNTIFGWRSTDSGETWKPVDTSKLDHAGSVYGHILNVPGKGLAVFGHFRPGSKPRTQGIWMAYSTDHGKTWGAPQLVTDKKFVEPAVVMTQGRFVGLLRQWNNAPYYWQAVSADQGKNWKLTHWPEKTDPNYRLPSPFVAVSPHDRQRLFALESNRHIKGNLPGQVYLWTADAKKLDWKRLGVVIEFPKDLTPRNDITYPWMIPLEGDDWFLVFYCGQPRGPSAIYGMRLTIKKQ